MNIVKLLLLISILTTHLLAEDSLARILVTKTTSKSSLSSISKKLKPLGVGMFVQKTSRYYLVFSREYADMEVALDDLKYVKRVFRTAVIIQKVTAKTKIIKSTKTIKKISSTKQPVKKNRYRYKPKKLNQYFVSASLGMANIGTNHGSGEATSVSLGFGYYMDESFFMSGNYLKHSASGLDISNLYASANYRANFTSSIDGYGGVLIGLSELEVKGFTSSSASSSMLLGVQVGASYNLLENLSLFSSYKLLMLDHVIKVEGGSNLSFDIVHNLDIGVRFRF